MWQGTHYFATEQPSALHCYQKDQSLIDGSWQDDRTLLTCHSRKSAGETHFIHDGSVLLSVPVSQHTQHQDPGTSLAQWNAVVIMLSMTPLLFQLWHAKMSAVKQLYYEGVAVTFQEVARLFARLLCVCVQGWCLWSRRVGRRQRRAARAISFRTCLHVGVWTSSVGRELTSTTAPGRIVRGD